MMSLDVSLFRYYQVSYDKGKTLEERREYVFNQNITHNLSEMAREANIYKACWRPEEIGARQAIDIIPILQSGYNSLKNNPNHYRQFDSPNGWGVYANFLPWVKKYLDACKEFPDSIIEVSR